MAHREPFYGGGEPSLIPPPVGPRLQEARQLQLHPRPQPVASLGQKSTVSAAPTASASARPAKARQEGRGRETLLQSPLSQAAGTRGSN